MNTKLLIPIITLFILMSGYSSHTFARKLPTADYIAVYFYADWCSNCKIVSHNMKQIRQDKTIDRENILFITLDLTDKPRIHQSILLAQALGLGEYITKQGSKTGYIAVLNAQNHEEVFRIDSQSSFEATRKELELLIGN